MDGSPPGSSVHGILQARTLGWVTLPLPGDLPDPGIKPMSFMSPALKRGFFITEHQGSQSGDSLTLQLKIPLYPHTSFVWLRFLDSFQTTASQQRGGGGIVIQGSWLLPAPPLWMIRSSPLRTKAATFSGCWEQACDFSLPTSSELSTQHFLAQRDPV